MKLIDLSGLLKDYQNKWVALSDDNKKIYGSGKSAKDAVREVESKGHSDYSLFFVRPSDIPFCGFHSIV